VDRFPFEVTESGWGEFQVLIKIFFVDLAEKPCILHHFLRLYPLEDLTLIPHPAKQPDNTVIAELYDEIVFHDPSLQLHQILTLPAHEALSLKPFPENGLYADAYRAEKQRLADTKKKILAEIERVRKRQLECEKKIKN
jgi:YEATS domain-containing protein 4